MNADRSRRAPIITGALAVTTTILLTTYGQIVLRWQLAGVTLPADGTTLAPIIGEMLLTNPWIASGLAAVILVVPTWMYVLRHLEVSLAFPFMSLAQAAVVILGILILGEEADPLRIAGVCLICAGVAFLGHNPTR